MNLIFTAFATLEGYREGSNANLGSEVFYRCIVVSLVSAKQKNQNCDAALVTNTAVPEPYAAQLSQAGIRVIACPFDNYRFEADLDWSLAYYKLCAMQYLLETEHYENYLMLDSDTFTQRGYQDIWREAAEAVLLYQVPHAASQPMTARISHTYDELWPEGAPHVLTHFGGEFVAGSTARLQDFMAECRNVFDRMQQTGVRSQDGDEVILDAAAYRSQLAGKPVRAANAYVFRRAFLLCFHELLLRPRLRAAPARQGENAPADGALPQIHPQRPHAGKPNRVAALLSACRPPAAAAQPVGAPAGQNRHLNPPTDPQGKERSMQEKKRIPLKRLHRLRNARKQAAETDDLTPMMKAIKAVHSVTSTGSTQPEDLERQRAAQELFGRLVTPNLLINTTPITVNNVSAEWVRMNQGHDRRHVVLYCHGGGYTCGQLGYARVLASKLALSTGCDVLSFEYRLAPEAPYPSAIDDALRVWDYLMYMGIGARDVIVAGDSAGGNLALELALAVKAQGRSQPRALVLMSPWTDMTMQGASYQKCAALDPMLTHDYIDSCRTAYRGANSTLEWEDPSLSPLFADLRGLPPTLIQVGTNEILKSDSINLAKAMTEQEVYAVLEVYPECWHVFQQMPIPHAAQAMESVGRFVQKIL